MPSYDVLLYHDLSSPEPLRVGSTLELHGDKWEVVSVERPVHPTKDALVVCKHHPARPPWPKDWREQSGGSKAA